MPVFARKSRSKARSFLLLVCVAAILFGCLIGVKALFPLEYGDAILEWSTAYELNPAWVAAVIRCESNFQPTAVSSAGAMGLMQIMPATGLWIAEQLQWADTASLPLYDPSTSIALGTWYLRYLLDRFRGSDVALMAYNAGPANVDLWDGHLEQAFPETQRYVHRVHVCLAVYRAYFSLLWLVDLIPSVHFSY